MNVVGVDYDTNGIDVVMVDLDGGATWRHFDLPAVGDAFARMREVANVLPARRSAMWDDTAAFAVEEPMSRGPRSISLIPKLKAMQGAIVACLPSTARIVALTPTVWRNAVGLPANASKDVVRAYVMSDPRAHDSWPQDACDAFCMALACEAINDGRATT